MSELIIRVSDPFSDIIRKLSSRENVSSNQIVNAIISEALKDVKAENIKIEKHGLKITLEEE